MSNTRTHFPLSSAIAGGMGVRISGSLLILGVPDMAHRTASHTIYCGILQ
jgi:hypothetical protein